MGVMCGVYVELCYFDKNVLIGGVLDVTCGLDGADFLNSNLKIGGVLGVTCGLDRAVCYFDNNLSICGVLDVTYGME
jgi:hypothetical protein